MVDNKNILNNPNFKKWFGNSKVVDKNGNPLRMYHGTGSDFIKFEHDKTGGVGFYFTSDPEEANVYADFRRGENMNIMPVYLSIQNPATTKIEESIAKEFRGRLGGNPRLYINRILQQRGYDGIIRGTHMIAFYPNQIKSAIGNNGNFDSNNPNILKEVIEEIVKETLDTTALDISVPGTFTKHFWLDPNGKLHRVIHQGHILWAISYLKSLGYDRDCPEIDQPIFKMYNLGWSKIDLYLSNIPLLAFSIGSGRDLNPKQFETLHDLAKENNIDYLRDDSNRRKIPLQESMFPKGFNRHSLGSCMAAAEMATKYFLNKGIKDFEIVEGWVSLYPDQEEDEWASHTWIQFKNGRIFDPTKKQWKLWSGDTDPETNYEKIIREFSPQEYLDLCEWEPGNWEKFKKPLKESTLNERMSFADLYDDTDDERIFKSKLPGMRVRPMAISMENGNETWNFGYTSGEKSEWERYREKVGHKGRIIFFKDSVEPDDNAEDLECMVDCDCRDFKYRFAYVDAQQDASMIGPGSLNKAINAAPVKTNPEGETKLCKHLAALVRYLVTNLERARQRAHLRRRPFNIFEAMDEMANKGSDTTNYYEKDKNLNESIDKVGLSPEKVRPDLPINWDAPDLAINGKWNEYSIRRFVGLPQSFIAIYPAIIDVNEIDANIRDDDDQDWIEFRMKKQGFPPIVLVREKSGKLFLVDGTHRVYWAQQHGYRTIGAWIADKVIQNDIDRRRGLTLKETRIITPEESLYEGYITLYHGTTWPLALKAKKGELGPQPLRDLVINVLVNVFHETPSKAAEFYDKHSSIRRNDPAMLFLTTNKKSAEAYARSSTKYGGEILMDVLGQYFWNSPAYGDPKHQKFVQEKLQTDEPAVVTVNVPLEMVLTHPHWITPLRSRLRDIRKNILKNPELKHILSDDLSMEVFVKEKIPARFIQRIDRINTN